MQEIKYWKEPGIFLIEEIRSEKDGIFQEKMEKVEYFLEYVFLEIKLGLNFEQNFN